MIFPFNIVYIGMTLEEFYDYLFYMIDMVVMIVAMIFSFTDAYTSGIEQWMYKLPLVALSLFFKYIYLCYFTIVKFVL